MNTGTQSLKVNFHGLNKQIEWVEISLVFDKTDQHQTVYDSYDVELATISVQLIALENASTTHSFTGQLEHNVSNEDDKHWLYQMFVANYWEGCSTAPLTQYKNNEIKQELIKEKGCFGDYFNQRIYIDMRCSTGYTDELEKLTCDDGGVTLTIKLKKGAEKKNETESYCLFTGLLLVAQTSTKKGYIMTYNNYSIAKDDGIAA